MQEVSKILVEENLRSAIQKSLEFLGGFEAIIKPGDTVLLKPNFNTADPYPASSDLKFIKIVVELVYKAGAKIVMLGDSSTMSANTRKVMEKLGVFELEKMSQPPRIYVFEERKWIRKEIPKGRYLKCTQVSEILDRADKLILLPCLKTHFLAEYSGALKLAVGFMKPFERVKLHLGNLQEKIAELNTVIHPDLILMDARRAFINHGPSEGEIAKPNLILASKSRIAIDIEGVEIIQSFPKNSLSKIKPAELIQIKYARDLGID